MTRNRRWVLVEALVEKRKEKKSRKGKRKGRGRAGLRLNKSSALLLEKPAHMLRMAGDYSKVFLQYRNCPGIEARTLELDAAHYSRPALHENKPR